MIQAKNVLEAWDKTLETMDFSHLEKYLSSDFQFEDTTGELDNLENTKSWCVAGGLRINNFKTIRENDNYIVATHDVIQEGKPKSNVLVYAEQTNGKFVYWKIQRAFEAQFRLIRAHDCDALLRPTPRARVTLQYIAICYTCACVTCVFINPLNPQRRRPV